MTYKFLNITEELTSKKNPDQHFHIVSVLRKAGPRDNVRGSVVCDQIFISPEQRKLFKDIDSGDGIELVYEDYGRYRDLVDVNIVDADF